MSMPTLEDIKVGAIGLGYVGLPITVYLARPFPVVGFDIDCDRIAELMDGFDRKHELAPEELACAQHRKNRVCIRPQLLYRCRSH